MSALKNFFVTFILSLAVFGVIGYAAVQFAYSSFGLGGTGDTDTDTQTGVIGSDSSSESTDDGQGSDTVTQFKPGKTVLFVLTDYRPGFYGEKEYSSAIKSETDEHGFLRQPREIHADVIMLMHISEERSECVFSAISSSTRVTKDLLNVTLGEYYDSDGVKSLAQRVMGYTALNVDYTAVIGPEDLEELIDDLDGVKFYVGEKMEYKNEEMGFDINLKKGSQLLNGKKALDLLRYPNYAGGESARRESAEKFMIELVDKFIKELSSQEKKGNAEKYIKDFLKYFESTDLTAKQMLEDIELIKAIPTMKNETYTFMGTTSIIDEVTYFNPNLTQAKAYFDKFRFQG